MGLFESYLKYEEKRKRKKEAINLRQRGLSIRNIANKLKVSKGSVSLWVKNVVLTEMQNKKLYNRMIAFRKKCQIKGNNTIKNRSMKIRKSYQIEGATMAGLKNPDFFFGCALYWGEGSKNKNVVDIANADLELLKVFLNFLRKFFQTTDNMITLRIQCYDNNGISLKEIENYWMEGLNLPKECLRKTSINTYSIYSKKNKIGKLPYGTARLSVARTHIVQKIFGAIQEICGFKNNNWLQGKSNAPNSTKRC